jgi:hypothetical protein
MNTIYRSFINYSLFLFQYTVLCGISTGTAADIHSADILSLIDFRQAGKDGKAWLREQGFTLKRDMTEDGAVQVSRDGSGLCFRTDQPAFAVAVKDGFSLEDIGQVAVQWRVEQYPTGASWEKNVNREAIMVTLFFGPPVEADHFYLPDSPYFIGLFLCQDDEVDFPYSGKSYRKTSRFVCLDRPDSGTTIVSNFKIDHAYRTWFATDTVPPVTGIGIELDTGGLDEGQTGACLEKITLYGSGEIRQDVPVKN